MRIFGGGTARRVVLATTVLGLTAIGLPAAPAAAAPNCTLTIERFVGGPEFYDVRVGCTEVSNITNFVLYGSDEWPNPDDFLTSVPGSVAAVGINGDILNEDVGGRDEVYAKVTARMSNGDYRTFTTNRVNRYFGCVLVCP